MGPAQIYGKEIYTAYVRGQPKNLVVLKGAGTTRTFDVHPVVEGINNEHGTGLTVISDEVAHAALKASNASHNAGGKFWDIPLSLATDALVAYEKPDIPFRSEIILSDYATSFSPPEGEPKIILPTGKHRWKQNVALVAMGLTSGDFIRSKNEIVVNIHEDRLIEVPHFPRSNGRYLPYLETGVPYGEKLEWDGRNGFWYLPGRGGRYFEEVRDLSFRYTKHFSRDGSMPNNFSFVGLLVRSSHMDANLGCAGGWLSVVAEVPDADVPKIQALIGKRG